MCCQVGFYEEFIVVFSVKMSQIDTENDKNLTFSNFQGFYSFLLKFRQISWIGIFQTVKNKNVGTSSSL